MNSSDFSEDNYVAMVMGTNEVDQYGDVGASTSDHLSTETRGVKKGAFVGNMINR